MLLMVILTFVHTIPTLFSFMWSIYVGGLVAAWLSGSTLVSINEVTVRRAWLVLG